MEGRRAHAVAHLAYARSQKSGTGILGSKRVLQGGEKSSPLVVLCDLWLVYRVYGLGGGKCGPGREIMVLGQALVAGSMVQGEKPRFRVKCWWREVWPREPNCGFGSSAAPPECGPRREIMVLGQALVAGSVVQGAKLRPGSSPSPPECGPRRDIMVFGQMLVAGSVVQGEKLRVWVKRWWREVWSREPNCGFGSSAGGGKCGPGREIMVLGQVLVAGSVVQGAKLRPWVKPDPAKVWSREPNCGPGSPPAPPKYGLGSKTAAPGHPHPRPSVVQGAKLRPGSSPAPSECGPRSKTVPPGHPLPRPSVV